jgi:tetratricopeptide (TPR) repeat protein
MQKIKNKKLYLITIVIVILFAVPISVYGYNYKEYKSDFNKALTQLNQEKYDESINTFNNINKTYFGKKNTKEVKNNIENAKKFKENKKVYDDALKLFNEKKYLEAIEGLKKIPKEDLKRYDLAKKKTEESKTLYIALNIENAKNEGKASKYDSAISFLTLVLNLDSANKDAVALKDEYTKAKQAAEEKAKKEAEEKAKKEAEEKIKKEVATQKKFDISVIVPIGQETLKETPYIPNHVQGVGAIKQEFQKMGFVFQSDTTALYSKNGIDIGLVNRGEFWQLSIKTWGDNQEALFYNAISIIWGKDTAWSNLIYIDYALDSPDSVFKSGNVQAFVNDGKLVVYIYVPK